jgi:predicted Zn-dependent protease
MNRLVVRMAIVAALSICGVACYVGFKQVSARREWNALRPSVPALAGERAPGLDQRLARCAAQLRTWPPNLVALTEFTRVCHANGELEAAAAGYRALIQLDAQNPRWPHLLASILAGYGQLDEALPLLRRTTELAPEYLTAWLKLGDALLKSNAINEAEVAYRRVLTADAGNPYGLLGLARCDLQLNRLTSARSNLQKAVTDHPDFASAQSLLATVFERLGNKEAADVAQSRMQHSGHYSEFPDPWLEELITDCHDPYTLLIAASAALADRKPEAAFSLLKLGLALAPQDARLNRQLAKTHAHVGAFSAARTAIDAAVALEPGNEAIRLDQLTIIRQAHDEASLESAVANGLAACATSAALHYESGLLANRAGRLDEATEHFAFAWKNRPDQAAAALELAKVLFRRGRPAEAVALLADDLLSHSPQESEGWRLLVRHGIATHDPRTGTWLQRLIDAHAPPSLVAELRDEYQRRLTPAIP